MAKTKTETKGAAAPAADEGLKAGTDGAKGSADQRSADDAGGPVAAADAAQGASAELVASAPPPAAAAAAPAEAAPAADGVRAYRVLSPLDHDGEKLLPGRDVLLTDDQAERLLGHTVRVKTPDDGPAALPPRMPGGEDPSELRAYRVLSPLEHDGKRRQVDAELMLTEAQAAPLLGHTVELMD